MHFLKDTRRCPGNTRYRHPGAGAKLGGRFRQFHWRVENRAVSMGYDRALVDRFFAGVSRDPAVITADRRQEIFQRPFLDFLARALDFAEPSG